MLVNATTKTVLILTCWSFGFAIDAKASNLNGPGHCMPMKVWHAPQVQCVDWNIGPTSRELTVSLHRRAGQGELQLVHEFRLYTHYLRARVEWLPLFDARKRVLSTLSEGQTGSNVSQTMWTLVGFAEGKCKPLLVESLDAQTGISSSGIDLKVFRQWVRDGNVPRIILTYRLTQRERQRARSYRWRDTLAWDSGRQQFTLRASRGDPHEVRSRIQAYRQKTESLTCESLRKLGADADFGLATILEDE